MTVHSFPRFPAFVLLLIMVLVGLIVDLNLKSLGFTPDSGSTSHRWLNQAYVSLAVKLIHEVQPPASSTAPIAGSELIAHDPSRTSIPQPSLDTASIAANEP
jgi:hypothetical protein